MKNRFVSVLALGALLLAGCALPQATTGSSSPAEADGPPPGMNAQGEVVDSSLIEAGSGRTVKGINDWEGEITGKPFPGAKFTKLRIGMPRAEVVRVLGPPTDEGSYITGKAFIPFYYGSDRTRTELAYKGQGRLVFSTDGGFGSNQYLTWIIYNRNDSGSR